MSESVDNPQTSRPNTCSLVDNTLRTISKQFKPLSAVTHSRYLGKSTVKKAKRNHYRRSSPAGESKVMRQCVMTTTIETLIQRFDTHDMIEIDLDQTPEEQIASLVGQLDELCEDLKAEILTSQRTGDVSGIK